MNNRKSAFLAMCAAESLRSCLAFTAFLSVLAKGASRPALMAAVIASPQLLLPLMWYYLWKDGQRNAGMKPLLLTAKALSAAAGIAWAASFIIGYAADHSKMDPRALSGAAYWGAIVLIDLSLAAASLVLTRGIRAEEG